MNWAKKRIKRFHRKLANFDIVTEVIFDLPKQGACKARRIKQDLRVQRMRLHSLTRKHDVQRLPR